MSATGDQANASGKPVVRGASHASTMARTGAWPKLKTGSRSTDVKSVQHLLTARGYAVSADGIYGRKTATAVGKFQKRAGLKADGVVGAKTWSKLTALTVGLGDRSPAVKAAQVQLGVKTDGVFGKNTKSAVRGTP